MARRFLVFFLALVALALPAATSAQTNKPVLGALAMAKTHVAGDALFVEWGGSWWKATAITPLPDGRTVIHYDGWSEDYDEVAKPKRLRTALNNQTTPAVGESFFVEWQGSWWPATVLKVSKGGARIHYAGYGPEWDEDVTMARIARLSPPEG
jgi:hypothetical protein